MARNYSQVGAPVGGAVGAAPTRSRKPLWIGAAALLAVLILVVGIAASCGGDSGDSGAGTDKSATPGIGSAHGPQSITNGIPAGYTRDKTGAATAGVNFIQAITQANQGRVAGDKLRDQAVSTSPTPALSDLLEQVSDRAEDPNVSSTIPVITTVPEFSPDRAVVSVWQVDAGQSKIGDQGKVGVLTLWSTTTVTLVWNGTDWKASDWKYTPGPNPTDAAMPAADSPLAQQAVSGYYSFYVD